LTVAVLMPSSRASARTEGISVDVRAADDARLEALEAAVHSSAAHGAASAGCEVALRRLWGQRAMPMAPRVRAVLARAVKAVGAPPAQLSSGAGHDAQALAAAGVPSGMLFHPQPGRRDQPLPRGGDGHRGDRGRRRGADDRARRTRRSDAGSTAATTRRSWRALITRFY